MTTDFFLGFVFCMLSDVVFSVSNFFVQRAMKQRAIRKAVKKEMDNVR